MRVVRNQKRRWLPPPVPGIGLAALAAGALCAAPMVGLDGYLGELAASWRPHIALALAVCAAMALAVRARLLAAVLVALALALGADVARTWWDSAQATARGDMVDGDDDGDTAVRVVFSNLSLRNDDTGKLVAWLKVSEPDVVVATEASPRHVRQLAEAMAEYPFRMLEPREHPFGMVVYSRYPLAGEAVTELAGLAGDTPPARVPIMVAVDVETPAGLLHVAGFHLYPPMTPRRFAWRNEQLATAGEVLAESMRRRSWWETSTRPPGRRACARSERRTICPASTPGPPGPSGSGSPASRSTTPSSAATFASSRSRLAPTSAPTTGPSSST